MADPVAHSYALTILARRVPCLDRIWWVRVLQAAQRRSGLVWTSRLLDSARGPWCGCRPFCMATRSDWNGSLVAVVGVNRSKLLVRIQALCLKLCSTRQPETNNKAMRNSVRGTQIIVLQQGRAQVDCMSLVQCEESGGVSVSVVSISGPCRVVAMVTTLQGCQSSTGSGMLPFRKTLLPRFHDVFSTLPMAMC